MYLMVQGGAIMRQAPADALAHNVKQCEYCHGPIDRFPRYFQCRSCFSVGDLITGIMTGPPPQQDEDDPYDDPYLELGVVD